MRTKDFASLLQLLDLSAQSGTLTVECEGETWQAILPLQDGKPLSCHIVDMPSGGILSSGDQAIDWLSQRGELYWNLQESPPPVENVPPIGNVPPSHSSASPPDRPHEQGNQGRDNVRELYARAYRLIAFRADIEPGMMPNQWPRDVLRVFALIDGVRSLAEIATLLRKPIAEVIPIFRELAARGFITMKEY